MERLAEWTVVVLNPPLDFRRAVRKAQALSADGSFVIEGKVLVKSRPVKNLPGDYELVGAGPLVVEANI